MRGRIGYAWDRVLLYVTGGVAWGKATYSANYATVAVAYPIAPFSQTKPDMCWAAVSNMPSHPI